MSGDTCHKTLYFRFDGRYSYDIVTGFLRCIHGKMNPRMCPVGP